MKLMIKIILLLTIITFSFALVEHLDVGEKKCFTNYNKIIVNVNDNCKLYIDRDEFCIEHIDKNGLCIYFMEMKSLRPVNNILVFPTRFEELSEEVKKIDVLSEYFHRGLSKKCDQKKGNMDLISFVYQSTKYEILEEFIDLYLTEYPEVINCQYECKTALMIASGAGYRKINESIVEILLKHNADVNLQDCFGWTALMQASRNSRTTSSKRTVEILLEHGADTNLQNLDGFTALMLASLYSGTESTEKTVELLLKYNSDVNLQNYDGSTALIYASKYSQVVSTDNTVELLLDFNSNPEIQDKNNKTALMHAQTKTLIRDTKLNIKTMLLYNSKISGRYTSVFTSPALRNIKPESSKKTIDLLSKYNDSCHFIP